MKKHTKKPNKKQEEQRLNRLLLWNSFLKIFLTVIQIAVALRALIWGFFGI